MGGPAPAHFTGQRQGNMVPYLRLRLKISNNATTTGSYLWNLASSNPIPLSFEVYNQTGYCAMVRTADVPSAWVNDGKFHDFDWTPASRAYNVTAGSCQIAPGKVYNIDLINWYSNVEYLLAADASGTPYMINSVEPIDLSFPPAATPYPPGVVWQSTPNHNDEVSISASNSIPFNGTRYNSTIPLGIWTGPDFTTDASTTVHVWSRSGDPNNSTILDVGVAVSSGGNPYSSLPDYVGNLIYGYPAYYAPHTAGWIPTNAPAGTTTQEQILPANWNVTIHHGDELWGFAYPSFASPFYNGGVNAFMGGTGNTPQVQICQGDCNQPPPPQYCTPGSTPDCNSNVMFLPGLGGSRLYRPSRPDEQTLEHQLWEPFGDLDAQDLNLDSSGKSLRQDIYTRDIIGEAYIPYVGPNIYKSFINKMNDLKNSGKIADWTAVPYDWRLSLSDIISGGTKTENNISYLSPTSQPYIMNALMRMASSSRTHKVTVVAHSNGGLVLKALLMAHPELEQYIDRIFLVDVPQVGTPQAIISMLHGKDQGIPKDEFPLLLSDQAARQFANNAPIAYNLLPSFQYFSAVSDPVVTFDSATLPDWAARYGTTINFEAQLKSFLDDSYQRVSPGSTNIKVPTYVNQDLLSQAELVHQSLDSWKPPAGIQVIQIAGWGIPTTIKSIEYASSTPIFCYGICNHDLTVTASTTMDGDGTVVTPSELWMSKSLSNVKNYWINLDAYNTNHWLSTLNSTVPFSHAYVLEVTDLLSFISDEITQTTHPISNYTYLSLQAPISNKIRLRYELHSPLSLNLYDAQNRHTGISTTTHQIETQIPGTYYMEFGDVKYLFTDISSPLHIVMNGYATSTFTFKVEQLQGDTIVATTTWKDMPVSPATKVTLNTISDISTLSPLNIDLDGNGLVDISSVPKLNDIASLYRFDGFLQPINDTAHQIGQSLSVFKAGSTVPVKLELKKLNGTTVQALTAPIWLTPQKGAAMNVSADESFYSDPGTMGASFKWDSVSRQYIYNWSTKGLAAGYWYKLFVKLDDGSTQSVIIGLK